MQLMTQSGNLGPKWFHVALRAMVILAETKFLLKSHQIADMIGADSTFIRKVLALLSKADLVSSYGGRYGGYTLEKSACEISVGDIYVALATEPPDPDCTVPSTESELYISNIISKAEQEFRTILEGYTLDDIVKQTNIHQLYE
ncbi:Rrf2 family transcriptional regulator [Cytobacillus sp. FJAT-54145]|uniref:HTH-type transcriptional regulator NsrR n=1 Tax=Cytobacillus spartinae TaxID=3299023 RepID=A0ABW6K7C8_9BACI